MITDDEFKNFKGAHCFRIYSGLPKSWTCPSCERSLRGIIHRRKDGTLTVHLHKHHDHGNRWGGHKSLLSYGVEIIICGACNSADGRAKRKLGLPVDWSYSVDEIKQFVTIEPHESSARINYDVALKIYKNNR